MGWLQDGFTAIGDWRKNQADQVSARRAQGDRVNAVMSLDWEPEYTPTYQRSQSPLADRYLESILTGTNPAMTFSGSPNAQYQKAEQEKAANRMHGTMADANRRHQAQKVERPAWEMGEMRSVKSAPSFRPPEDMPARGYEGIWDEMSDKERTQALYGHWKTSDGAQKRKDPQKHIDAMRKKYG